jgi:ribosome-associated protein
MNTRMPSRLVIPFAELSLSFARAGGPGGQNVNKVETKVSVAFDFMSSTALRDDEKARLRNSSLIQRYVNADGLIVVSAQEHRSQGRNRDEAIKKLHELIVTALRPKKKRIPTSKTKASNRRRLETKKLRSTAKMQRRRVAKSAD